MQNISERKNKHFPTYYGKYCIDNKTIKEYYKKENCRSILLTHRSKIFKQNFKKLSS